MIRATCVLAFVGTALASPLASQAPASTPAKSTITQADYDRFESVGGATLSPDGKWVTYTISRGGRGGAGRGGRGGGGGGEFHYRSLATGVDRILPGASSPTFTSNGRWMLFTQAATNAAGADSGGRGARGGAGGGGRGGGRGGVPGSGGRGGGPGNQTANATPATQPGAGVLDLNTGATSVMRDIQSYVVASDGRHVAMRHSPTGGQTRGADLVVRNLETGADITFGNVAEFGWSSDASTLAMVVDVNGRTGNGVQLYSVANGTLRSLDAGDYPYFGMQWRDDSGDLAVFRGQERDTTYADSTFTVVAWRRATGEQPEKHEYDFAADGEFPEGMRVPSYRALQWSKDGSTLFFGIAPRVEKLVPRGRGEGPNPVPVEVWHWTDRRPWHAQANAAAQDRRRTHLVAWPVGASTIVRLADERLPNVTLSSSHTAAIGGDDEPYFMDAISGRARRDVYTVDVTTGQRTKVLTGATVMPTMSPSGRYLLYTESDAKSGNWFVLDVATGTRTNLTGRIRSVFVNMEDDHPLSARRGWGVAGWLTGEQSLILYDQFDLWQVNVDGTNPVRLTRGREDGTVYRADWTGNDDLTIDPAKPILLSATGEFSRKDGYSRLTLGQPVQRLLWVDKSIGALVKARDADVYAWTAQTAAEPPQLNVSSGAFTDAEQVTNTNEWLKERAWGKQTLMDYRNSRGDRLQMMLTYPADYEPGKKYAMVVYYYEKLSQGFHNFIVPSANSAYNVTVFSQAGYFVLRPDIRFEARNPGFSGLDCVTAAVKTALAAVPDIDAKKVGNFGHSWGGYQSAFYAVHGKGLFAASIAGAPLTNLISMYGYTNPNGGAETGHFETGQERMQVSLWEDPAAYIRNSTVFGTNELQTPLLLEAGDDDTNVNFYQSMELFNFGRRLGKRVVFLVYQGQNHGVTGDAAIDYQRRQLEWFGYWLKGEPPASWIVSGESYLDRQKILDAANPPSASDSTGAGGRGAGGRGAGGRGGGRGGRGGF